MSHAPRYVTLPVSSLHDGKSPVFEVVDRLVQLLRIAQCKVFRESDLLPTWERLQRTRSSGVFPARNISIDRVHPGRASAAPLDMGLLHDGHAQVRVESSSPPPLQSILHSRHR